MIEVDLQNMRGIIWLASYPRSGNTWIRALIAAMYRLTQDPSVKQLDLNALGGVIDVSVQFYGRYLPGPPDQIDPARIAPVRPRAQREIVIQAQGAQLVKTHSPRGTERGIPLIDESLTAGAVYVVRNPLDIAVSVAAFRNISIDETIALMANSDFGQMSTPVSVYSIFGTWSENVQTWTANPDPRILVLRYEDMLEAPEQAAKALGDHVRLAPPADLVAKAVRMASFDELSGAESLRRFGQQSPASPQIFRSGKAGQWRSELDPKQVDRIVADHRDQMARFNYLP